MAISASATPALTMSYTITDTQTDRTISESATVGFTTQTFANGTGYTQVNAGVSITGVLGSGSGYAVDLTGVPKRVFDDNIYLNFTSKLPMFPTEGQGIRGITITNTYEQDPSGTGYTDYPSNKIPYITIAATGAVGYSGMFGEGSGGFKLFPQSTWSFTNSVGSISNPFYDPIGAYNNYQISLIDSGSGVPFQLGIVGVTGGLA